MSEGYDLMIVGAGCAGLSAALQAARDGLKTLIISGERPGGLVRAARRLDNLPGFPRGVSGALLADLMERQTLECGAEIVQEVVVSIKRVGSGFAAETAGFVRFAPSVIIAAGTRPLPWPFENCVPKDLIARDARSIKADMKDKRVIVIGGGEAALDTALSLADRGARVEAACRAGSFKAPSRLVKEAAGSGVRLKTGRTVKAVRTSSGAAEIFFEGNDAPALADMLLVCIGREPNPSLALVDSGEDISAEGILTSEPGLFLAGDAIRERDRFAAAAMGDGQLAARAALNYLKGIKR